MPLLVQTHHGASEVLSERLPPHRQPMKTQLVFQSVNLSSKIVSCDHLHINDLFCPNDFVKFERWIYVQMN